MMGWQAGPPEQYPWLRLDGEPHLLSENPEGVETFLDLGSDWNVLLPQLPEEEVTTPAEDADEPDDDEVPVFSETPRTPWWTTVA